MLDGSGAIAHWPDTHSLYHSPGLPLNYIQQGLHRRVPILEKASIQSSHGQDVWDSNEVRRKEEVLGLGN